MKRENLFRLSVLVFGIVLFYNVSIVNNPSSNDLKLEILNSMATAKAENPAEIACFWWADNLGHGSILFWDCYICLMNSGDNPRYQFTCPL